MDLIADKIFTLPSGAIFKVYLYKPVLFGKTEEQAFIVQNPNNPHQLQVRIYAVNSATGIKYISKFFHINLEAQETGELVILSPAQDSGYKVLYRVHRINKQWNGRLIGYTWNKEIPDTYNFWVNGLREGEAIELDSTDSF